MNNCQVLYNTQMCERGQCASIPETGPNYEAYVNIAGHELRHALVGFSLGYLPDISLQPNGDSIARVSFHNYIPLEDMQTIAVASMVSTADYSPHGFSHDMWMVQKISEDYKGNPVSEARVKAGSILSYYPPELLRRASEIIVRKWWVSGEEIPSILEQAKNDLSFGINGKTFFNPKLLDLELPQISDAHFARKNNNMETVIDNFGNNKSSVIQITIYDEEQTDNICSSCGGIQGYHAITCIANKHTDENIILNDTNNNLPLKGRLYTHDDKLEPVA